MFAWLPPLAEMLSWSSAASGHRASEESRRRSKPPASTLDRAGSSRTTRLGAFRRIFAWLPQVVAMSMSVASAKTVRPIVRIPGDERRDLTSSVGATIGCRWIAVGVGGEVLAPVAVEEVAAEPAEQNPRRVRPLWVIEGDIDVFGVPQRGPRAR